MRGSGSISVASGSRTIVVTGDDFGADAAANAAIVACFDRGVLTQASLMAGEPAFAAATALARDRPALGTGLHLVLCDGRPVSAARSIPDLVDASGRFPADPARTGLRIWRARRRAREQLEREVRAQIETVLGAGLSCDHVDGHHHLHMHPVVFDVLHPLLGEYGIGAVRLVEEDVVAGIRGAVIPTVHRTLARRHRRRYRGSKLPLPAGRVYGLRATGAVDEAYLLGLIPRLRAACVELYCHPGRGEGGARERDALCSPRVRRALAEAGYRLARSGDRAASVGAVLPGQLERERGEG